ncbi:hypothetical protein JQV19_06115 [Sulfitobacter mediterraneus]|uniref:hypothetical protein n=1 Tax=Sulfitobacter mediterraneus TaxID=83219 RepID=UPI00193A759C|nr:hypothetical protein [Sulfitobacter mediterraneus]MBM1556223.1 hypothetical protein [Sulfitobacter mediterraneus]MBM1567739.1 hypothetical protein [Sulfitobacter mediterraneus]MBM1571577.1 hypothetical protein [Sulfitobacter mediterraneus]MBM1575365.1 hypothetical protein [Sulfitobacter mediterraneus]MBM1579144.1 hypothetical protein [Sulfitobacter mediterraneus]
MTQFKNMPRHEKIAKIEQALDYVGVMITNRAEGDNYVALYERLEGELQKLRARDDLRSRILRRQEASAFKLAA